MCVDVLELLLQLLLVMTLVLCVSSRDKTREDCPQTVVLLLLWVAKDALCLSLTQSVSLAQPHCPQRQPLTQQHLVVVVVVHVMERKIGERHLSWNSRYKIEPLPLSHW